MDGVKVEVRDGVEAEAGLDGQAEAPVVFSLINLFSHNYRRPHLMVLEQLYVLMTIMV